MISIRFSEGELGRRNLCYWFAGCAFVLCLGSANSLYAQRWLQASEARAAAIHEVRVPAREPGVIASLTVQPGANVAAGDVVATIDDRLLKLELAAAEMQRAVAELQSTNDINVRFSEKSNEVARADVRRSEVAVRAFEKSISKSEIDQLRLVAERSALAREQAELELKANQLTAELRTRETEIVQQRLIDRTIRSPIAGVVVEVFPRTGEWVTVGAPILHVVNLDRLRVETFVAGTDVDQSHVGRQAVFNTKVYGQPDDVERTGNITFVSPVVHPVTGEVKVWAEIDNSDHRIKPGMRGVLRLDVGSN